MQITPLDVHNRALLSHTHPPGWVNPAPAPRYNLVVIGGGTAGLVAAAGAAGLGARVALVERALLGGDCLNSGCVPSKTLIRAAHAASAVREAARFGVHAGVPTVDFEAVMERVRRVRAAISPHDSAERMKSLGVDVFLGEGRFSGADTLVVGDAQLCFRKAVIATGARAAIPAIPGLAEAGFLTNETVFNLTELPRRLVVLGAGPIGCELAQAFARLGSRVTLVHTKHHVLDKEDPEAASLVQAALQQDGVELVLDARAVRAAMENGERRLWWRQSDQDDGRVSRTDAGATPENGTVSMIAADAILVATGRAPNVANLALEAAGVAFDTRSGVTVDDAMRTTNRRIFASGDVCSRHKFTHAADFMSRIVLQNALFLGRKRASALTIPRVTYTDPEIACVGLTEHEAAAARIPVTRFVRELEDVDRSKTDGETVGFVKILVAAGTDRIVGATLVAKHAGEMLGEVSVAMAAGFGLGRLANVIHPYPTVAEAIRQCGDQYNRTRLTPTVKRWFERWMAWTR